MDNKLLNYANGKLTVDSVGVKALAMQGKFKTYNANKNKHYKNGFTNEESCMLEVVVDGVTLQIRVTPTIEQLAKMTTIVEPKKSTKKSTSKKVANNEPSKSEILAQLQALAKIVEGLA